MIEHPAISTPHQGASYNPPVDAHQDLLRAAHEMEEAEMKGADKGQDVHERMMQARQLGHVTEEGLPPGMTLHGVDGEGEEEIATPLVKPTPARKTKQQRRKAQRALDEVRISPASQNRARSTDSPKCTMCRKGPQPKKRRSGSFWHRYSRPSWYEKLWNSQRLQRKNCKRRSGEFFGRDLNRGWWVRNSESTLYRRRRSTSSLAKISQTALGD